MSLFLQDLLSIVSNLKDKTHLRFLVFCYYRSKIRKPVLPLVWIFSKILMYRNFSIEVLGQTPEKRLILIRVACIWLKAIFLKLWTICELTHDLDVDYTEVCFKDWVVSLAHLHVRLFVCNDRFPSDWYIWFSIYCLNSDFSLLDDLDNFQYVLKS